MALALSAMALLITAKVAGRSRVALRVAQSAPEQLEYLDHLQRTQWLLLGYEGVCGAVFLLLAYFTYRDRGQRPPSKTGP